MRSNPKKSFSVSHIEKMCSESRLKFRSPPTLARTTTTEICDEAVGLKADALAQLQAERFVRAALAFKRNEAVKEEKRRRKFQPSAVLIALPAEEADEIEEVADVATVLAEQTKPASFSNLQ
ncbi:hypothetical protein [Methylobacterium sp. Leaf100]|uniref:hypothetical protein n=1 Tax=Methylobacterium sp. Leaf100 TaxID=1736252 RepID=UPI000B332101|nr:hypothetical protein [Methylobacterium sp. Leaf100]